MGCPVASELKPLSPPSLLLSSNNTSDDKIEQASPGVFNRKRQGQRDFPHSQTLKNLIRRVRSITQNVISDG